MKRSQPLRASLLGLLGLPLLATPGVAASQAVFTGLGDLPGGFWSTATAISADGTTVVGESATTASPFLSDLSAFRWTRETGMVALGEMPGGDHPVEANGVSGDGRVIVGDGLHGATLLWPFMWTPEMGTFVPVHDDYSRWNKVSDDGLVVVGQRSVGAGGFRWTRSGGFESLAPLENAVDVSADGAVVAGNIEVEDSSENATHIEAARWTADGVVPLGVTGSGFVASFDREVKFDRSLTTAISADGSAIVGEQIGFPSSEAFLWTEREGMRLLGDLPGGDVWSEAYDVSGNGRIVVGSGTTQRRLWDKDPADATVWDARHGMRRLQDVLEQAFGLDLTGWHLEVATAISNDGKAIAGEGTDPDGKVQAFLVTLPRAPDVVTVAIDIEPGVAANPIRFFDRSVVRVALLGSASLDVRDVDPTTLEFGPAGARPIGRSGAVRRDVNHDGRADLVATFRIGDSGIALGDTQACLSALDLDGNPLEGCDAISTLDGCGRGFPLALVVPPLALARRRRSKR
jgi:probable HAF family extracellular repeat protein